MTNNQIEKLIEMGGKRWTKNGMDRIYMDGFKILGIDPESNIRTYFNDYLGETVTERLSNRICNSIKNAKIWIDVETGDVHVDRPYMSSERIAYADEIRECIETAINETEIEEDNMSINEINTIEELEEYTETMTGMSIVDDSLNDIYADDTFGPELCEFTDAQQDDLKSAAKRILDCISTARRAGMEDLVEEINGRFWAIIDSVREAWADAE